MKDSTTDDNRKRVVTDQNGHAYELLETLGSGGQGTVYATNYPGSLVKMTNAVTEDDRARWLERVRELMRLPLDGLRVARPRALITSPRPGYVMQMMDGLVPLMEVMEQTHAALSSEGGIENYLKSGGIVRRLKILARLAEIVSDIHGRGLAYGDLSPSNIYVSKSVEHSEVWLIDADNMASQVSDLERVVYTQDYGAPELVRSESGMNTLTDIWSFSVIAYQLLTVAHPLKGDMVNEGDPEKEETALRGDLPWVGNLQDNSNSRTTGLPQELVIDKPLQRAFDRCFDQGLRKPGFRPSMEEWRSVMKESVLHCATCESCGGSYIYNHDHRCSWCDHVQKHAIPVLMKEYYYTPPEMLTEAMTEIISKHIVDKEVWFSTSKSIVIGGESVGLRKVPYANSFHDASELLCKIRLTERGLHLYPGDSGRGHLQDEMSGMINSINHGWVLENKIRSGKNYFLHLGDMNDVHVVWRFVW